jgi:hypothetical protein
MRRATLAQAFVRHDTVIEADQGPDLAPGARGAPGQTPETALRGADSGHLQGQADVGRGDDPGGAPRRHVAGALGDL